MPQSAHVSQPIVGDTLFGRRQGLVVPLPDTAASGECAADKAYLGGTGGSKDWCDMLSPAPYASGRWVRNCAAAAAMAQRRVAAAFDAFQFAGYNTTVTGPFGTVPNADWDIGGRSALCFGPAAAPLRKNRHLDTLFWNWRPNTCSLRPLDRMRFGQLLRNEKVMFVGDSMMNQLASSTWALTGFKAPLTVVWLLVNPRTLKPMEHEECRRCQSYAGCMSGNRSREQCRYHAGMVTERDANACPPRGANVSMGPIDWTHALSQAGVLVLNTGAHLNYLLLPGVREHIPHGYQRHLIQAMARNVAQFINARYRGLLVWLVTPHFAEACWNHTQPLTRPAHIPHKWGWDKIVRFDAAVRKELRAHSMRSKHFTYVELDTTMSRLRPDQHPHVVRDCLHFCYPGQMDTWSHVLFNILLQHADNRTLYQ